MPDVISSDAFQHDAVRALRAMRSLRSQSSKLGEEHALTMHHGVVLCVSHRSRHRRTCCREGEREGPARPESSLRGARVTEMTDSK